MNTGDSQPLGAHLLETGITRSPQPAPDDNDVSIKHHDTSLRDLRRAVWGVTSLRVAVHALLLLLLIMGALLAVRRFTKIFEDFAMKLPMTTELLLGIGNAMLRFIFVVPPALGIMLAIDGTILYHLQRHGRPGLARLWFFLVLLLILGVAAFSAIALFMPFVALMEGLSK
jgi:hypothetical protein